MTTTIRQPVYNLALAPNYELLRITISHKIKYTIININSKSKVKYCKVNS